MSEVLKVLAISKLEEELESIDRWIAEKTREMEQRKKFQYELCRSLLSEALENGNAQFHYLSQSGENTHAVVLVPLESLSAETTKRCFSAERQTILSSANDIESLNYRKTKLKQALDYAREAENWDTTRLLGELIQMRFGWLFSDGEQHKD